MKSVNDCTDEELAKRIALGDRILSDMAAHNMFPVLPAHLERQYKETLQEQKRRASCINGDSI